MLNNRSGKAANGFSKGYLNGGVEIVALAFKHGMRLLVHLDNNGTRLFAKLLVSFSLKHNLMTILCTAGEVSFQDLGLLSEASTCARLASILLTEKLAAALTAWTVNILVGDNARGKRL